MDQETLEIADRFAAIVETAVDGIISIDETGEIQSVNPAAERIFGFASAQLIGSDVSVLMPAPYRDEHAGYVSEYLRTGRAKVIGIGREVTGRRRDGSEFPLYLAVSEGRFRGERIFTGICRDLSEIRQAEERAKSAEQLASLSVITAGIAHDIGTPLHVILGYSEMLRDSLPDPKDRRRAEVITEQVRRVTDLLQTLLNIARPGESMRARVRLGEVLDHALDFFREKLAKRNIEVERIFSPVPELVGDRDRLEQVFLNLISNAVDAMPTGGRLMAILETDKTRDGDFVRATLADTGVGMDPETCAQVFEPFYTTKERGKGNGLGLVVSKSIVTDHGGTIECESEPEKGTRFSVILPVDSTG